MDATSTIKQGFVQRLLDFQMRQLDSRDASQLGATAMEAVVITGDLLDAYGDMGSIAEHFADTHSSPMENGMYGAIMYSITIEHERLDEFLLEIHRDCTKFYPQQLLAKGAMLKTIPYFATSVFIEGTEEPRLWCKDGRLLHDPTTFMTTHGETVINQLNTIFMEDGSPLVNVIDALPSMEETARSKLLAIMMNNVIEMHLCARDPRRQKILAYCPDRQDEAKRRLTSIFEWLNNAIDEQRRTALLSSFSDVFDALGDDDKQSVMDDLSYQLSMILIRRSDRANYDKAVTSIAEIMRLAVEKGLGSGKTPGNAKCLKSILQDMLEIEAENELEFINTLASSLPAKHHDHYCGQTMSTAMVAAYLMLQDSGLLLELGCNAEALLGLYILKDDHRFKDALKTPEHADMLLAHDLGL
jgi:hypothetical protein